VTYDEVGIIQLQIADDTDYSASDRDANSGSGDGSDTDELSIMGVNINHPIDNPEVKVGRFTPDHFTIDDGKLEPDNFTITPGVDGFTYMGQRFSITINSVVIDARNAAGARTQNYDGAFWKLESITVADVNAAVAFNAGGAPYTLTLNGDCNTVACPGSGNLQYSVVDGVPALYPASIPPSTDGDGSISMTFGQPNTFAYSYQKVIDERVRPFNTSINLTFTIQDNDLVVHQNGTSTYVYPTLNLTDPLNNQQLFGRVALLGDAGTQGPETLDHTLLIEMQNVDNFGDWVRNGQDTCGGVCPPLAGVININPFDLNNIMLNGVQNAGANATIGVGGGTTTVRLGAWLAGRHQLTFDAPGAGHTGTVTVTTDLLAPNPNPLPWLDFNPPASAELCFGCDTATRNIMYQREPWR